MKLKRSAVLLLSALMLLTLCAGCAKKKQLVEDKPKAKESVLLGAYHYTPEGELDYKTYMEYDEQEKLVSMTNRYSSGDLTYRYAYNDDGQLSEETPVDDNGDTSATEDTPAYAYQYDQHNKLIFVLVKTNERTLTNDIQRGKGGAIDRVHIEDQPEQKTDSNDDGAGVMTVDAPEVYDVIYTYSLTVDGGLALTLTIENHQEVAPARQVYDKDGNVVEQFDPEGYDETYAAIYIWAFALMDMDGCQVPFSCELYAAYMETYRQQDREELQETTAPIEPDITTEPVPEEPDASDAPDDADTSADPAAVDEPESTDTEAPEESPEDTAEPTDGADVEAEEPVRVVEVPEESDDPETPDGTMKLIYGEPDDDPDAIIADAETPETTEAPEPSEEPEESPEPTPEAQTWREAYKAFVLDGGYRSSGQSFYSYEEIRFGLHDLNADGSPELFITNGDNSHAGATTYAYTYSGGSVVSLGSVGNYPSQVRPAPGTGFPGLFTESGNMGSYTFHYYSLSGTTLTREAVCEATEDPDTHEILYQSVTGNDALYNACWVAFPGDDPLASAGSPIRLYTAGEINSMGWDAFTAGY